MKLGYIGLGKIGFNMVQRLLERGYEVAVFDKDESVVKKISQKGAIPTASPVDLVSKIASPRLVWLMVPHEAVDLILGEIVPYFTAGDSLIDGGNSFYKDSIRRAQELEAKGFNFLDVGVSGGPSGARSGACLMVGGQMDIFQKYETIFRDLAVEGGYGYLGSSGAGHFVKMVHNGIEYGMMQALAEGFSVLKNSEFKIDLEKVARLYNQRSVIESRLVGWLGNAFEKFGGKLESVSGSVGHTGEAAWMVKAARELGIPVPIIEGALRFRLDSEDHPSYTGKILSALRNQFGGHDAGSH